MIAVPQDDKVTDTLNDKSVAAVTSETKVTTLSVSEIDALIEKASSSAIRKAFKEMGLIEDELSFDIRTLRGLAKTLKTMQHTFVQTLVRWLTIGMLVLIFAGLAGKFNPFLHK